LASLLDVSVEAVVVLRRRGLGRAAPEIVSANRAFGELIGHSPERIVGRGIRFLRPAGARDRFLRLLAAIDAGEPFSGRIELARADGRTLAALVRGVPFPAEDDFYALFIGPSEPGSVARGGCDLVERLGLASTLGQACLYVLRVGADCRLELEWADPAIRQLTGYTTEELRQTGGFFGRVAAADLAELRRRNQAVLAGRQATVDYRVRCRDGSERWLRDTALPERLEPDEPVVRVVGGLHNIDHEHGAGDGGGVRERFASILADTLHAVVMLVDWTGVVRWASAGPVTPLADAIRSGVGRPLDAMLEASQADEWLEWIERTLALQERTRFRPAWTGPAGPMSLEVALSPWGEDMVLAVLAPAATAPIATPEPAAADAMLGIGTTELLDALDGANLVLSPDLRLVGAGSVVERLMGAKPGGLRGLPFTDLLVSGADRRRLDEALAAAVRGERAAVDATLRRPDDHVSPLRWRLVPLLDAAGQCMAILARGSAVRDRLPGDRTRHSEPSLSAIIDSVVDGIITLAGDGTIETFSRSAEEIFEYARAEVLGRHVELLLTAGPSAELNVLKLLTDRLVRDGGLRELFARRRSGEVIPVEIAVTPLDYDEQRVFILTVRDITVRRQTEETLRNLAYLDALTGLPNRLLFHDRLMQSIERARRSRQMLAVLVVDLDRFKLINDSLGLEKGDQVLRAVADRLNRALRRSDTVARLGGDEFMLLAAAASAEAAAKVAQKVLDTLRPPFSVNGHELTTGASIGIALFPHDGDDADTLIKNADTALSRAKEQGRNHYQFYTNDMNATAFERLMLESRLRKALEQGELVVHYQPQLSFETGRIVGVEALVRWFHPDLGMVPPAEFIPLAEETGLIVPIGEWVLRTACRDGRRWQEMGFAPLRVAVNLSARQFQQRDLVESVGRVLEETSLPATDLELELTESVIMRDAAESVRRLRELTALGIQLAVDDFGTGYSSLGYLRTFPIRSLKIDRSFIRDIDRDPNGAAIAQAIIALASSLSLKVIAEGVETREQLDMLRGYGCQEMQGYFFCRPLPADELLALLREDRRLPS
jgi:diguanylate cyclase (GGDEF)-like protein/PAS domain S-box-containing protein